MNARDPRDIITPTAFRVVPELLGVLLAGPWRRGLAMLIDGLLIAILANAPGVLLAATASAVFFRISSRSAPAGYLKRAVRFSVRAVAALLLFITGLSLWGSIRSGTDDPDDDAVEVAVRSGSTSVPVDVSAMEGVRALRSLNILHSATTEAEALAPARAVAEELEGMNLDRAQIREILAGMMGDTLPDWGPAVLDSVAPGESSQPAEVAAPDSLLQLTADTLRELQGDLRRVRERNAELTEELEQERDRGIGLTAVWRAISDDLGIGLGWSGLFFTAFLALWEGQTPGKRLLGMRVVRLDGKPLGWWAAFERFGGYAASFATGLLGFAQIFWDPNRQAIHDKIVHTVVVLDSRSIAAGRRNPSPGS